MEKRAGESTFGERIYLTPGRLAVEDLRQDGKLLAYSWPSGYPYVYVAANGDILCAKCANDRTPPEIVNWFLYKPKDPAHAWYSSPGIVRCAIRTEKCDNLGQSLNLATLCRGRTEAN